MSSSGRSRHGCHPILVAPHRAAFCHTHAEIREQPIPFRPGKTHREEHEFAGVNRYAVERIDSELELPFFFPGATQEPHQDANPPQLPPTGA